MVYRAGDTHNLQFCTVTCVHEDTCGPTTYKVQLQDGSELLAGSRNLQSVGHTNCSICNDNLS